MTAVAPSNSFSSHPIGPQAGYGGGANFNAAPLAKHMALPSSNTLPPYTFNFDATQSCGYLMIGGTKYRISFVYKKDPQKLQNRLKALASGHDSDWKEVAHKIVFICATRGFVQNTGLSFKQGAITAKGIEDTAQKSQTAQHDEKTERSYKRIVKIILGEEDDTDSDSDDELEIHVTPAPQTPKKPSEPKKSLRLSLTPQDAVQWKWKDPASAAVEDEVEGSDAFVQQSHQGEGAAPLPSDDEGWTDDENDVSQETADSLQDPELQEQLLAKARDALVQRDATIEALLEDGANKDKSIAALRAHLEIYEPE